VGLKIESGSSAVTSLCHSAPLRIALYCASDSDASDSASDAFSGNDAVSIYFTDATFASAFVAVVLGAKDRDYWERVPGARRGAGAAQKQINPK
jgi:hypothetical protein